MTDVSPDPELLLELIHARMPFGRYVGTPLLDLPEPYVLWLTRQPDYAHGKLRAQLGLLREIKINGLEALLAPLRG